MKRKLILPPPAETDLHTHIIYLAENAGIEMARRFNSSAKESFDRLCETPFIGVRRDFSLARVSDLRMWFVKNFDDYMIFYLVSDDAIRIVRVLHSSQDIDTILSTETVN
jgi:toxin ParE1/3/4